MIRLIFVVLFLVVFLILSIPVFLIEWLIGKVNPRARDISSLRIVQAAFKVIAFLSGCHVTVIGVNNLYTKNFHFWIYFHYRLRCRLRLGSRK